MINSGPSYQQPRANLATLVDQFEANHRDIAIVSKRGLRESATTYGDLALLARRFGAYLEESGIRKGDRVVIWGENCTEWTAAFFGCVLRGVLPVPLDYAGSTEFARLVVQDVRPRLLVGDPEKLSGLPATTFPFPAFGVQLPLQRTVTAVPLRAADPLQIVFTSGTTGQPKGIVHTHGNVLASLEPIECEIRKYLKYEKPFHPIRILHTLPLSHVFGQFMGFWTPPLLSAEVHLESHLVMRDLIGKIRRDRISVLAAVPRVLELMQAHILDRFPSLKSRLSDATNLKIWQRWWHFRDIHAAFGLKFWAFVCGGASLPASTEKFWGHLGFVVVQGYGMTETTALVSLNHPFHAASGTIGQVLPGREVKLGDDGEVLVRGRTISNLVWQQGHIQTQHSEWLHTGDLAEFDASGNLKFRGRKKEVIVTASGLNIYPEDLEAALARQSGIKACAVIESEGPNGPEPLAVLVLTPGTSAEGVVQAANFQLSAYQQIRRWQIWPKGDLPRTSTGKVLKREIILDAAPAEPTELNLDSLGRVELQARVEEQYGVSLNDADLESIRTREDLDQLVRRGGSPISADSPHVYWTWPWNPFVQLLRTCFLEAVAMPILRFLAQPIMGERPADWPDEPALIICNHVTAYDAPFVLLALPPRIRHRVAIAMSGELLLEYKLGKVHFLSPIAYWLITALFNVFPLPRSTGLKDSFRHAAEAVKRGYSVLIFPEGHRSDDGKPQPFRVGAGLLWKELLTPLIPVRIDGLGEIKTRKQGGWFRSSAIIVNVGEVLTIGPSTLSPEELTEKMRLAVFAPASTTHPII